MNLLTAEPLLRPAPLPPRPQDTGQGKLVLIPTVGESTPSLVEVK